MTGLVSISIDVLAEITALLNGGGLLRLWMTGDFVLHDRLRKGGVKEVSFEDSSNYSTTRWPMMIGELYSLEKLTYLRDLQPLGPAALIWRELSRLRRLVTLNFFVHDTLSILECGRENGELWMENIFPLMRKLNFGHLRLDRLPSWLHLPSKLEGFGMLFHQTLDLAVWPLTHEWSKITSMKIMMGERSRTTFDSVPFHQYCPHLEVYYISVATISDEWLSSLPHSLTELHVMTQVFNTRQEPFSSVLPPNLITMEFQFNSYEIPFNLDLAEHQKLKSFKIRAYLSCDVSLILLPPQLTLFDSVNCLRPNTRLFLPPALTHFEYMDSRRELPQIATWDPTGAIDPISRIPTKFTLNSVPKGLRVLKLATVTKPESVPLWKDASRLPAIESLVWECHVPSNMPETEAATLLEALNPKLRELSIPVPFAFASLAKFTQLRSLDTTISETGIGSLKFLPRTLQSLTLDIFGHFGEIDSRLSSASHTASSFRRWELDIETPERTQFGEHGSTYGFSARWNF
jgi:hypothetical protein